MRDQHILFTTKRPDVVMDRGDGMHLWDTDGKQYLDFIGGWAVNALGHSPRVITQAISEQAHRLLNASPAFLNTPMIRFAEQLADNSCFDRAFFGSSGAEANESAIKLARKYGQTQKNGAYEIITTQGSFHGRTLATMSATGKAAFQPLFEPKVPGFVLVDFNDIDAVEAAITDSTCAVMLEPIQGEGGVNAADHAYMQSLRNLCDETNTLLIFDEIQTGFGRTGTLFCYEHYGIEPDIMTLGKGIGGGFPLSAMLTKEAYNIFEPGEQGGTYTGQPLAMAVGNAVLTEILETQLLAHVQEMEHAIKQELEKLAQQTPTISRIRGKGLLLAFDIEGDAPKVAQHAFEQGLIINASGPNTIRLIPPLIVEHDHVQEMLKIMAPILNQG